MAEGERERVGRVGRGRALEREAEGNAAGGGGGRPPGRPRGLAAAPWPTAAGFTAAGAYSWSVAPLAAAAARTAPRASPSRKALWTLRATKARSRTTAS